MPESEMCVCGDNLDDHKDAAGECLVDDCGCIAFDLDDSEDADA